MKKERLFLYLAIGLAIINIGLVSFLFMHRQGPPNHPEGRPSQGMEILQSEFGFDDSKKDFVEQSVQENKSKVVGIQQEINKLSLDFYLENDPEIKDSLLSQILDKNKFIYLYNTEHLQDLMSVSPNVSKEKLRNFIHASTNREGQRPRKKE